MGLLKNLNLSDYLKMSVISLIATLFSYLLIFFIGNYAVLYFSYDFDIGAWFDISGVHFEQLRENVLWTYDAEVTIFLSKPLIALTIAIISLSLLLLINNLGITGFLFLLWMNIVAFNACFGLFVDDFITQGGLLYVAERMELNMLAMMSSLAITTFIMIRLGMVNSTIFSLLLPEKKKTKFALRTFIVLIVIFLPWLLSGLLIFAFANSSHDLRVHLNTVSTFLIILPFFYSKGREIKDAETKKIKITTYDWLISGIMLILSVILFLSMLNPIRIWGV
jgi:hypothetical protein